ncbi:hypothetical protein B0H17DRAFT_1198759 [Mycena rosella]|uniref:Uncharacterized protein n=1 Tax=Mycena rosella TaxID=1033263 RepID=A0AAD7GHI7_MYCRO|nr:hypothetical protein B0H17DRAFT_1198759 [Mycena rosella]
MDDPWANAWGEPPTTSKQSPAPAFPPHAADDEEDITIPTWEAPAVNWSDENSLWGARSPALDKFPSWQSPYDDLPLGKPSTSPPMPLDVPEDLSEDDAEEAEVAAPEPEPELAPESPVEPPFEPPIPSSVASPISRPISPPGSPDAFGTFESGLDDIVSTSRPWSPSRAAFAPDAADSAWGAAWAPSDVEEDDEDADAPAVVDEWEAAKQQKAMQDKHVPPELLASILLQFTELANDLYPPLPTPTSDPDDYRASRHKGMNGIDTLNPTVIRLLPTDLTLPPPRPFLKSAVAKHTADSLRLSRSAAFVRSSPLSHYSATKGSTAWEASVKRRPEPVGEADLLPPGWRVVETKKDDTAVTDKKKTGHGGLLSFFGRRSGTPPVVGGEGVIPRSSSPASASSPRASMDSVKSPTASAKSPTNTSAPTSATVSPTASSSTPPPPPLPVAPVLAQADTGADADPITPSAPSAVSRFLGRFGRKAPAATGPQNLALSEGDFDFLSDIEGAASVPSLDMDAHFPSMGALLDAPVALPAKLAPPPRVPVPVVTSQTNGVKPRPEIDHDEPAIFGTFTPPPPLKPTAPPLAQRISTPTPVPTTMPPVDSDIDFSAWGFDDEEKSRKDSGSIAGVGTAGPATRQPLNTRAPTNTRGVVPPPRRAPTAIMSSGPFKPAVVPKLDATFGFPPPPRTQTQTPTIAALPPPPGSKAAASVSLFDNDDDFSDFHVSPISPPNPSANSANSFYDASFSSSTSSERGLFSSTSSTSVPANLFDDFDDFMQASPDAATLRTPSPPRPPAKLPPILSPPPAPLSFPPPTPTDDDTPLALIAQASSSALRSKRAAANHQRALSLVENAAASSGVRWPAPPSPLPEALTPPPDASDPFNFGGSSMQSQQAAFFSGAPPPALKAFPPPPTARALSPPAQSPVLLARPPLGSAQKMSGRFPPPAQTPVLPLGGAQKAPGPALPPPSLATPLPTTSAARGKSSGGLSAQDLSFFEGL